jgi:NAD(P)-dependent dehydrogenase (short-subunit alcohol dehydrogenase family)
MSVAVITGGSRGIGAATALALASYGFDICLSFRADRVAATTVVGECLELGVDAAGVRADVRDEDDVLRLFEAADELGPLGALVNNAGITAPRSRLDELSAERIESLLAVNVLGSFLCARSAVLRMSTAYGGEGGSIVNVSSAAARLGSPGEYVDYAATKGAIDTMTLGLAKEVAREGIRVNAVRPGLIKTEIHASGGQPDRVEERQDTVPLGRGGEVEEVANAIAWLCSDEASYVTGSLLDVSGGR